MAEMDERRPMTGRRPPVNNPSTRGMQEMEWEADREAAQDPSQPEVNQWMYDDSVLQPMEYESRRASAPSDYQDRIAMALNGRSEPDGDERGGPMPPDGDEDDSDMGMMMKYGPEEEVAYDQAGRPIPLADPRHPMNQQRAPMRPSYPQQRR